MSELPTEEQLQAMLVIIKMGRFSLQDSDGETWKPADVEAFVRDVRRMRG